MKLQLPLSAAVALIALTAFARMGESPSEINKRYGDPTSTPVILGTNEYFLRYKHAAYDITVTFWNGKSVSEILSGSEPLSDEDALTLFKSISGESDPPKIRRSDRDTGPGMTVDYDGIKTLGSNWKEGELMVFSVESKDYLNLVSDRAKTAQKKKLDSF